MIYTTNFSTVRKEKQMITKYEKILELDNVTLEDCVDLYEKKGMCTELNDGRVVNFIREE